MEKLASLPNSVFPGDGLPSFLADHALLLHVALVAKNHTFHVLKEHKVYIRWKRIECNVRVLKKNHNCV